MEAGHLEWERCQPDPYGTKTITMAINYLYECIHSSPFRDASNMCVPSSGVNVLTQKKSLYNL